MTIEAKDQNKKAIEANSSDSDHLRWLADHDLDVFSNKSILDLGCGSGYICAKAMQDGAKFAVGVDIVTPRCINSEWTYQSVDLDSKDWSLDTPRQGEGFDLILAFDIVEHMESPYQFLLNCQKLLSPKGVIVLTTPNILSWERFLRPTSWSGVQDPQHKVLFSKYSLQFLLSKVDLKAENCTAPIRKLKNLAAFAPQIGGQMICIASKAR